MRPTISNTPHYMLNVPDLSGGINLRDGISAVNDNQLLEATNVWFDGGMLKTRPALKLDNRFSRDGVDFLFTDIVETDSNGKIKRLVADVQSNGVEFFWLCNGNYESAFDYLGIEQGVVKNVLICKGLEDKYYVFVKTDNKDYLYRWVDPHWYEVNEQLDQEGYIPTVYLHCKTGGAIIGKKADGQYDPDYRYAEFEGTQFEGYNLINDYYKIIYSTVNPEIIPVTETKSEEQYMKYLLPADCPFVKKPADSKGKTVQITIKHSNGKKAIHTATVGDDGIVLEADYNTVDELKMQIKDGWLSFLTKESASEGGGEKKLLVSDYVEDNMEIILPGATTKAEMDKVFGMTRSAWYGGEANGMNGGTRLFLCGNNNNKNLVLWSDVNNPSYFPANNYAYVGDGAQAVTGFGKQEAKLVIFKEREIYYTQYVADSSVTAENLVGKSVVDITSTTAYFPMIQINANIGCDLPETIQLCDNRLVWANKSGRVYTMISSNQYNENNVYEISEMLGLELAKNGDIDDAFAVDWDGRYVLFAGDMCYLLEYSSYGFRAITSYSKSEDANKRVVWWVWKLPVKVKGAISDGNDLTIVTMDEKGAIRVGMFDKNGLADVIDETKSKILSSCQTKYFDFGSPTVKKTVPKVSLVFKANGGEEIRIVEKTDNGSAEHSIIIDEDAIDDRDPESLMAKLIRPAIKNIRRIAFAFESEGSFAIESIMLQYKKIGGLK